MGVPMQAPTESGSVGRRFWTVMEVAEQLGIHDFTVRRLCWEGKLQAVRHGNLPRTSPQSKLASFSQAAATL
jgi:excisionase family DNA binding protein